MKDKNWRKAFSDFSSSCRERGSVQESGKQQRQLKATYLVGTENTESSLSLGVGETVFVTLQQREDVGHADMFNVDLVLVVEIWEETGGLETRFQVGTVG